MNNTRILDNIKKFNIRFLITPSRDINFGIFYIGVEKK